MRNVLKIILKFLTLRAINKHGIELVVVTGWTGVELVKEGIYSLLSEKYIVRRNVKQVWWDLSIPLNILGYEDKQRNLLSWVGLIFQTIFVLIFAPRNKHTIVLSAHSENESTAKYWEELIKPDYLVIIQNFKRSKVTKALIKSTKTNAGIIIHESGDILDQTIPRKFIFGNDKSAKVLYETEADKIIVTHKDQKIVIPKEFLPPFARNIVASIVSFGIVKGISFEDINGSILKYDLRNKFLKEVIEKIGEKDD